jgi:hypothetical protein
MNPRNLCPIHFQNDDQNTSKNRKLDMQLDLCYNGAAPVWRENTAAIRSPLPF